MRILTRVREYTLDQDKFSREYTMEIQTLFTTIKFEDETVDSIYVHNTDTGAIKLNFGNLVIEFYSSGKYQITQGQY